ncbi:hypothetical protein HMPREF9318_00257 [Streptococcus urinalis FB127-CNA-2]|uniref:Sensor histidine kinase family protein n=1 Tax=Streptococcus urinalis 2285-97 TaxID=764291 RepID=G5KFF8_9STRE|nr:sensor histidine kinase family protein [Streptococcus urinalis 2285-97]EKS22059.1 hypothetical protein HMPREF9318_00257 [Streptococcus urinalis FB127-CNA-2]VEF31871.1 two component system histidine kinase [Streptococcus urinalis]
MVGIINTARYYQSQTEIRTVLNLLADNNGNFPSISVASKRLGTEISPDTKSRFRYYSVLVDKNGKVLSTNLRNILALNEEETIQFARQFIKSGSQSG